MSSGKIKIVHLIPSFERAGAETIVSNICNFLPEDKYDIHIVVLGKSTAGIIRINPSRNIYLHVAGGFPFRVKNNLPRFNLKAFLALRKILRSENPDIIHSHLFESFLALNLLLISFGLKCRFVHTAHTNSEHYKSKTLRNKTGLFLEKFVFKKLKALLVCVSLDMFGYMKRHFSSDQLEIVRNSIDTEFFKKELVKPFDLSKINIPKSSFVLLHIGRFAEVKNHPLMFSAVEILKNRKKNVVLLCLGYRGGLWEQYQTLINEKKLNDSIHFVGEVDDPRPYIAASNIGLLPSFHEGLSLALLEMFSMELPVFISKIPSSEEVVNGMTERLFIDVNDASQIADKIEDAMLHYNDYLEIGRKMRNAVIESFSVLQLANNYDKIYKNLIDKS